MTSLFVVIIVLLLLLSIIFGNGLEFGVVASFAVAILFMIAESPSLLNSALFLVALIAPIPLAIYILAVVLESEGLNQAFVQHNRKVLAGLIITISMAAYMSSGLYEQSMLAFTNIGPSDIAGSSGATLLLASISAAIVIAFLVGGVVLSAVLLFEFFLHLPFTVSAAKIPLPISTLRPYCIITLLALSSNLIVTLFVEELHPFSILKLMSI